MIKKLTERNSLIVIVVFLVIVKFAFVPLLDWQQLQIEEIERVQARVEKGKALASAGEDIASAAASLQSAVDSMRNELVFSFDNEAQAQLQLQQMMESLIKEQNLALQNLSWRAAIPKGALHELRLELRVKGDTHDLTSFLLELESHRPVIAATSWNLRLNKVKTSSLGKVSGLVRLTFPVEYGQRGAA